MYQALYRKFRPQRFEDVKGQDAIVTTLQNQIRSERIGHAYLFCGTRGTGKTTLAKLFARTVNCENIQDGNPCGKCDTCKQIAAGNSVNVIEMDAASNNGVDAIRQIVEEVAYSPSTGKYKVYIIDEAHMISTQGFNALLKTLEEPPSYVIFILATTEANRIPVTILSRCQRYDFRRISQREIAERMRELAGIEGLDVEDGAYDFIAKCADGSMRDALSLLDECVSFYFGETLTYEKALKVLGAVDTGVFSNFFRKVNASDTTAALKLIDEVVMEGREIGVFISDFIWYLRNMLLISVAPEDTEMIDVSSEAMERLREEAGLTDPDRIMRYIRIMSELSQRLRFAPDKRVLTEIAVIRLCKPHTEADILSLSQRVAQLEQQLESGIALQPRTQMMGTDNNGGLAGKTADGKYAVKHVTAKEWKEKLEPALPEDIRELIKHWGDVLNSLEPLVRAAIRMARPSVNQGKLYIIAEDNEKYKLIKDGNNGEYETDLRNAINTVCGKEVDFVLTVERGESYDSNLPKFEDIIRFENVETMD